MNDLKQHISLPIPSLKDQPRPGSETRDERLKAIITNLEKYHEQVRNNIANAAITQHQARLATQNQSKSQDEDEMDLDTPTSPPQDSGPYNDATFTLIANLNAPHDPKNGDPCLPPGGRITAPAGVVQAQPPEGMKFAKEVLDQIAEYDLQARAGREYYAKALERRGSSSAGIGGGWNGGVANASGGGSGSGPHVHPDRMRQVDDGNPFRRRW